MRIAPVGRFTQIKSVMIEVAAIVSLAIILLNGLSEELIRLVKKIAIMLGM